MPELSAELRRFVAETPLERQSVLAAVARFARELPPGARVLDAGAGNAPYRELFAHCHYITADWENSICLTAPLVSQLHEEPFDFFRYTTHGLRALLESAGFEVAAIDARTGYVCWAARPA